MDTLDGGAALHEHLERNPQARHASLHDPEYAAEAHRLRTVLGHLDAALADEGLTGEARQRVAGRLVAGCLGTDEATERMRARTEAVKKLMEQSVVHIDAETARRLLEHGVPSVSAP